MNSSDAAAAVDLVLQGKYPDEGEYIYLPAEAIDGLTLWGQLATYSGGGYVASLGKTLTTATDCVENLMQSHWMDHLTRALVIQFNLYNANSNLFSLVTVCFEQGTWGGLYPRMTVQTLLLYRYNGGAGVISIVTEIVCIIWLLYRIVVAGLGMVRQGRKYWYNLWHWADITVILALVVGFSFYILRSYWTVRKIEQMMNNKGTPFVFVSSTR